MRPDHRRLEAAAAGEADAETAAVTVGPLTAARTILAEWFSRVRRRGAASHRHAPSTLPTRPAHTVKDKFMLVWFHETGLVLRQTREVARKGLSPLLKR